MYQKLGYGALLCALSLNLVSGCNREKKKEAQQKAEQAEQAQIEARAQELVGKIAPEIADRARAEEAERRAAEIEAERDQIQREPNPFFEASGLRIVNLPNHLRSVQAVTLTNKSRFPVQQIIARVDFLKDGLPTAQIPLNLTGTLPASGTKTFAVSDKTLEAASVETDANDTQVTVTSVVLAPEPTESAALTAQ